MLSKEDEVKLWSSGGMGVKIPKIPAFYVVSLRGGAELQNLKPSQLTWHINPDKYVYNENVSKNCSQASSC